MQSRKHWPHAQGWSSFILLDAGNRQGADMQANQLYLLLVFDTPENGVDRARRSREMEESGDDGLVALNAATPHPVPHHC